MKLSGTEVPVRTQTRKDSLLPVGAASVGTEVGEYDLLRAFGCDI